MPKLASVVLYSRNIFDVKEFYEVLGFSFTEEKPDNGLLHFSTHTGDTVIEIYSTKPRQKSTYTKFAFYVSDISLILLRMKEKDLYFSVFKNDPVQMYDPDGRIITLLQNSVW